MMRATAGTAAGVVVRAFVASACRRTGDGKTMLRAAAGTAAGVVVRAFVASARRRTGDG